MAVGLEGRAQLAVVLDDAVEHDRELRAVAADERVRVRLGDCAVSRPARMAEARGRDGAVGTGGLLEVLEIADGADVLETIVLAERDAGRVVAAVLETLESIEQERLRLPPPDVSDDPAHSLPPSLLRPG